MASMTLRTNQLVLVLTFPPKINYGFGADQAKPHYGFGSSYYFFYHNLPHVYFNDRIHPTLNEAGEIYPLKPSSYIPRHNILQLK